MDGQEESFDINQSDVTLPHQHEMKLNIFFFHLLKQRMPAQTTGLNMQYE
jgi:hypothetical protein